MYKQKSYRAILIVTVIVTILIILKLLAGFLSNSTAILSDAVHSITDLVVAIASLIGIYLANKPPDKRFNYGYYKIENLVSFFVSLTILGSSIELIYEGAKRLNTTANLDMPIIAFSVTVVSALVSLLLGLYLNRVSTLTHSPTISANAKDKLLDSVTSIVVLGAILASYFGVPCVEGIITITISLLAIKVGLEIGKEALLVLLDTTDETLEKQIGNIIKNTLGVVDYTRLRLRKTGASLLGDCEISVSANLDIDDAHKIAENVERNIKEQIPQMISFVVHIEPAKKNRVTIVFPVDKNEGLESQISPHFGKAQFIVIVDYDRENKKILKTRASHNPFLGKNNFVGLALTKWVIRQNIHVIIAKNIGEIAYYRLKGEHVDVLKAECQTVSECIEQFNRASFEPLIPHDKESS
ncbi:MAG: cation diffusion facilitator family transporter [Candidatus Heimdallarchaeaceae archaeon]